MVQWLKEIAAFPEDTGSILSTLIVVQSVFNSSSRGSNPSSGICGHQAHIHCADIHTGETPIYLK